MAKAEKILVLGLDGMEPDTTLRMVKAGKMPNVQKLLECGAARRDLELLGAMPTITPAQWTTLATGCYPGTHGITDFWNPDPEEIDTIVYGLDSRLCKAEQLWNVFAEAGKKTLVWQWPGSSWPPSSESENLYVVDGTQPASVNYSIANVDIEKYIVASREFSSNTFIDHIDAENAGQAAADCVIDDLDLEGEEESNYADFAGKGDQKSKDEFMLNRYKMQKIKNLDFHEDRDGGILSKIPYDRMESMITEPSGWGFALPDNALEFAVYTSGGKLKRPCLILANEQGKYDRVVVYKTKKIEEPLAILTVGEIITDVMDDVIDKGQSVLTTRYYKLLELADDGSALKMWMSTAFKVDCSERWSPKAMYKDVIENVGYVPPFSQMGGINYEFSRDICNPVWNVNMKWQARAINYLIEEKGIEVVFSHHHFIDHQAHQYWNYALQKAGAPDEAGYQALIDKTYEDADEYIGMFMHLLDEGWTIMVVSDHGEQIHYDRLAALGTPMGVSIGVMKELGWTVLKRDETGQELPEIDWSKTKAVATRTSYIWINLKGRNPYGIVEPEDKAAVEEAIIDSLYAYKDPKTGQRIIGNAFNNRDAKIIGLDGAETGDIIFMNREGCVSEHGNGLSTYRGAYGTTVSPIFIAAGQGIIHDADVKRVIRQVDVAPTIAALAKIRMPKNCEGAPIYQIIDESIWQDFVD